MDQSKPLLVAIVQDDAPSPTALGRVLRTAEFEQAHFGPAEAHIDAGAHLCCRRRQRRRHVLIDVQERLRVARSAPPIIVTTSRHGMVIPERAQQNGCAAFSR